MGFEGTSPCSQTKGMKEYMFYPDGDHPESVLLQGDYEARPIMFGSNSYEGSYMYGSKLVINKIMKTCIRLILFYLSI